MVKQKYVGNKTHSTKPDLFSKIKFCFNYNGRIEFIFNIHQIHTYYSIHKRHYMQVSSY